LGLRNLGIKIINNIIIGLLASRHCICTRGRYHTVAVAGTYPVRTQSDAVDDRGVVGANVRSSCRSRRMYRTCQEDQRLRVRTLP